MQVFAKRSPEVSIRFSTSLITIRFSDTALGFSVSVSIRGALNICGAFIQSSVKQRALGCSRAKSHYLALLSDEQIRVESIMTTLCWIWTGWSLYPLPHTEK